MKALIIIISYLALTNMEKLKAQQTITGLMTVASNLNS